MVDAFIEMMAKNEPINSVKEKRRNRLDSSFIYVPRPVFSERNTVCCLKKQHLLPNR